VVSHCDSFLDPRTWPQGEEIDRLRVVYGWSSVSGGLVVPRASAPLA